MGIFDGILIASDWDGTLCKEKRIPDKNIEAIRYFQQNGGAFTVCSGRYYPYIESFSDKVKPNTTISEQQPLPSLLKTNVNGAHRPSPTSRRPASRRRARSMATPQHRFSPTTVI